jgi:hypothetical protein
MVRATDCIFDVIAKQQPMLSSGPLGASLHECRAALIETMLSTPGVR